MASVMPPEARAAGGLSFGSEADASVCRAGTCCLAAARRAGLKGALRLVYARDLDFRWDPGLDFAGEADGLADVIRRDSSWALSGRRWLF